MEMRAQAASSKLGSFSKRRQFWELKRILTCWITVSKLNGLAKKKEMLTKRLEELRQADLIQAYGPMSFLTPT